MTGSKRFYLFIFILLNFISAWAQNSRGEVSLKILLLEIGQKHGVIFNYIEDEVAIFKLNPPDENWELSKKIKYLNQKTHLRFKVVGDKYFTVYNDPKYDKPLCGYLIDEQTAEPIENAIVQIEKIGIQVTTEADGHFELPVISPNPIHFIHQSFESKTIDPQQLYVAGCPKILLKPHFNELTEVIAERFMTSGITQKKDGSLLIKPKKFGLLPGLIEPDVLQTLQQLPGVNSIDETISNMSVRGGSHDQNLFLWNGIRMFQTGHFFGLISVFNPSLAHEITFIKNGTSAFFGESVSSVSNISTHHEKIDQTGANLSANMISSEGNARVKLSPKAYIEVSGRRSFTDFFNSPTFQQYNDRVFQNTVVTDLNANTPSSIISTKRFYFYDMTFHYLQKIGTGHELSIDAITIRNTLGIDQYLPTAEKYSRWGQENLGTSMRWKAQWTERFHTEFNASTSYYKLNAFNESVTNNQITQQSNSVMNFGAQLKSSYRFLPNWTLNNGYTIDEIGVTNADNINDPAFSRNIKNVSLNQAAIAELEFKPQNNKTRLTFGTRVNYFGKLKKTIIEPRFFWQQSLTDNISLNLSGEFKSQSLEQIIDQQRDFLGLEKRRWVMADGNTTPIQKSKQIGIGLSFKNKKWLLTLDNFYKKVDGITSREEGFQNQFEFSKAIGQYEILGTEIFVQRNFNRWYTWLSYSFNQNQYLFPTLYEKGFPNNYELVYSLANAIIYDWKSLKIALGSRWHSGKPYTTPTSNIINTTDPAHPQIDYQKPNNERLTDYFQLNASASKTWKFTKVASIEVGISVLNILNKQNLIHRYYRINAAGTGIENVDVYALSRTPNMHIKVSF
ncbi:MAG: TonB-dependent receptor [Bacteroidetes bacterium]|nr:TonB-dependent receptor [Bacteroidota bacterium]